MSEYPLAVALLAAQLEAGSGLRRLRLRLLLKYVAVLSAQQPVRLAVPRVLGQGQALELVSVPGQEPGPVRLAQMALALMALAQFLHRPA